MTSKRAQTVKKRRESHVDDHRELSLISQNNAYDYEDSSPENSIIPEKLKVAISQELWNSYSTIRRESFKQILQNPNNFFYRNRPPGDPQVFGKFTREEEALFLKRVKYFREVLEINDGCWGLFAVPLSGRVGYQCSNFYRIMIAEHKIIDKSYSLGSDGKYQFKRIHSRKFPPESLKILEDEAFRYIAECLKKENHTPTIVKPINVDGSEAGIRRRFARNSSAANESKGKGDGEAKNKKISKIPKPIEIDESIVPYSAPENIDDDDLPSVRLEVKKKPYNTDNYWINDESSGSDTEIYPEDEQTPIHFALDPITRKPMLFPMLDGESGIVMDKSSWVDVFNGKLKCPYIIYATDITCLIYLNIDNFNKYCSLINNIPF